MTEISALPGDKVGFLRSLPLMAGVDDRSLLTLAQASRWQSLPQGQILFLQEDGSQEAYLVRSGAIAIVLAGPAGRELVINEMRPGDCFGELALLTGLPRSSTAVARLASEVLVIPADAFRALLAREPQVVRRLLEMMARRLLLSAEREGAMAFLDAQARLARILLQLDEQASAKGYVTISQEELARRAGLTRQTVAKALGRWRRRGWLLTGRGNIVLLNPVPLRQLEQELTE